METKLVKTGDLDDYIATIMTKQNEIIEDCQKILPYVRDVKMKTSIEKQMNGAKILVEALERGYIPVPDSWGFQKVDTKSKWSMRAVKETLATMPQEVKDVWERVKAEGFFDSFSVTVRGGGDPLLVGNKGNKRFLIGAWLHIANGFNIGFTVRH